MRIRNLMVIFAFCLPTTLVAQSTNNALCGVAADAQIFETLSRKYTLVHGPGTLSMRGSTWPFPQSEPILARIIENEGRLLLYTESGLLRLFLTENSDAVPLAQAAPGTVIQETFDQLNAAACPRGNLALPYFSGEGSWDSTDGVQMEAVALLVFTVSQVDTVHAWGAIQSDGGGVEMFTQMVLDEFE